MTDIAASPRKHRDLHPLVVMLAVILLAALVTHLVDAGKFQRHGKLVVPGTYHVLPKMEGWQALTAPLPPTPKDKPARAAGIVSLFTIIPDGMVKSVSLITMVLFVGGMFRVVRRTGAIDAGIDRMLALTSGNVYVLSAVLMVILGLGSTFLGFISEYLIILPIVNLIGQRVGLPNMFAMAVVGISAKVGYAASVTNPFALTVAQPLADVPIFSGIGPRLVIFCIFLLLGMGYVMLYLSRTPHQPVAIERQDSRLNLRHSLVLLALLAGAAGLITGARLWGWASPEAAAYYVALAVVIAMIGRLKASEAADAFIDGMQAMLLAAVLVGLASSVELMLTNSQVMDTLINAATHLADGHAPPIVANALMAVEMLLDVAIPSVSGKAALSIPILLPIAQLSGLSGQTTVLAFVLGSGLMNMVTPTSGMLLAYLSSARVTYLEWLRFIAPLWVVLALVACASLTLAALFHF